MTCIQVESIVLLADALAQQTSLTSITLLVYSILQTMFSLFIQIMLKKTYPQFTDKCITTLKQKKGPQGANKKQMRYIIFFSSIE